MVGINLLSEAQMELSARFSTKTSARYQFDDLNWSHGPNGTTLFRNCAAVMEAAVAQAYEAGDHTIFIGEILWADPDSGKRPLVYSQGGYARLAPISIDSARRNEPGREARG
jgi:flavin reductase (DIM6/NTAB) family NADH-FMN oxidoreductase RutF